MKFRNLYCLKTIHIVLGLTNFHAVIVIFLLYHPKASAHLSAKMSWCRLNSIKNNQETTPFMCFKCILSQLKNKKNDFSLSFKANVFISLVSMNKLMIWISYNLWVLKVTICRHSRSHKLYQRMDANSFDSINFFIQDEFIGIGFWYWFRGKWELQKIQSKPCFVIVAILFSGVRESVESNAATTKFSAMRAFVRSILWLVKSA